MSGRAHPWVAGGAPRKESLVLVGEDAAEPMYLSVGYTAFSGSGVYDAGEGTANYDADVTVMPLMLTKYYSPETMSANKLYYGVGAGVVRTKTDMGILGDDTSTDFAWQLVGGMNYNEKWFGEIKYFNGSDDLNTGLTASIGARF
jgi:opacity protein-like surface antigen